MIRPIQFRMNEQTAVNNYYQKVLGNLRPSAINIKAVQEFDTFVDKLRTVGIQVIVINDTQEFDTPDSVFPNNWISFHQNGTIALYPMFAKNRRLERKESILEGVEKQGFLINSVQDYTNAEDASVFLEGTGSIILDRKNREKRIALFHLVQMRDCLSSFAKILIILPSFFQPIKRWLKRARKYTIPMS